MHDFLLTPNVMATRRRLYVLRDAGFTDPKLALADLSNLVDPWLATLLYVKPCRQRGYLIILQWSRKFAMSIAILSIHTARPVFKKRKLDKPHHVYT